MHLKSEPSQYKDPEMINCDFVVNCHKIVGSLSPGQASLLTELLSPVFDVTKVLKIDTLHCDDKIVEQSFQQI